MEIFISIEAVAIALLYFLHFDMDGRVQRNRILFQSMWEAVSSTFLLIDRKFDAINVEQAVKEEMERRMH